METVVIIALLLFLVAAVIPALYHVRRRVAAGESRLQLWRALHRRGLSAAEAAGDRRALEVALRRCTLCPNVDACDEWLASGERDELERFCPNAAYLRGLETSENA